MKLWKRAAGALKDRNSLMAAADSFEAAIVKATSHKELSMDYDNAHLVYRYVSACPSSLKALVRALSTRVSRTRSWPVALKGLMLMHGVFLWKVPEAESIGRLPFDLSCFGDSQSRPRSSWGFVLFVRTYFAFLDQRSILFHDSNRHPREEESSIMIQLVTVRKMQNLIDKLIQVKPMANNMRTQLIVDAMDSAVLEILEIYGRICSLLTDVLPKVHSKTGKGEAEMALKIVERSRWQGEELSLYFRFCKEFRVPNAREIPDFVQIPKEEVILLEKLVVHGVSETVEEKEDEKQQQQQQRQQQTKTVTTLTVGEGAAERSEVLEDQRKMNQDLIPDLITLGEDDPEPVPVRVPVCSEKKALPDLISL